MFSCILALLKPPTESFLGAPEPSSQIQHVRRAVGFRAAKIVIFKKDR